MEITKQTLLETLYLNKNLNWTGRIATFDKSGTLEYIDKNDHEQVINSGRKGIFYEFCNSHKDKYITFFIELRINPYRIKCGKVFKEISTTYSKIPELDIENTKYRDMGKIKNNEIFTPNLIHSLIYKLGKNYVESGNQFYLKKRQDLMQRFKQQEITNEEFHSKLDILLKQGKDFQDNASIFIPLVEKEKKLANFSPKLYDCTLQDYVLNVDESLFWTGNLATFNDNNSINIEASNNEIKTITNTIHKIFEFKKITPNDEKKLYVELSINPYEIKCGNIYSKDAKLNEFISSTQNDLNLVKPKKRDVFISLLNRFKKEEKTTTYINNGLPNEVDSMILSRKLNNTMMEIYGDDYYHKARDYFLSQDITNDNDYKHDLISNLTCQGIDEIKRHVSSQRQLNAELNEIPRFKEAQKFADKQLFNLYVSPIGYNFDPYSPEFKQMIDDVREYYK